MKIRSMIAVAVLLFPSVPLAAHAGDRSTLFAAAGYCLAIYNVARVTYQASEGKLKSPETEQTRADLLRRVSVGFDILMTRISFKDETIKETIIAEIRETQDQLEEIVKAQDGSLNLPERIVECDYLFRINR